MASSSLPSCDRKPSSLETELLNSGTDDDDDDDDDEDDDDDDENDDDATVSTMFVPNAFINSAIP